MAATAWVSATDTRVAVGCVGGALAWAACTLASGHHLPHRVPSFLLRLRNRSKGCEEGYRTGVERVASEARKGRMRGTPRQGRWWR